MTELVMTKGLPASGKSTEAKKLVGDGSCYKRVNKDDLRAMLDNNKWSKENEAFVLRVRDIIVNAALVDGYSVIVDDTNFAPVHEAKLRCLAEKYNNVSFRVWDFTHVPVEECIRRDRNRPNYVGEKVIRDMYKKYLAPKPTEPPVYDPGKSDCILVDVDGTVALMRGRGPFEWGKVGTDAPNDAVVRLVQMIGNNTSAEVIFLSGRDECCRQQTTEWLKKFVANEAEPQLHMRSSGDNRDDRIVKHELYEKFIAPLYNVRFVLDDRDKVVAMWRALGLTCLQVAEGDF